jgi:hypothetical protein
MTTDRSEREYCLNNVQIKGDVVTRPIAPWSSSVHQFLRHLAQQGELVTPEVIGSDESFEYLTYVQGETTNYPLVGDYASLEALVSCASLQRKLHDSSVEFLKSHSLEGTSWMLPTREPVEVICHSDLAPYNLAFKGAKAIGIFDFDTIHPGPRIWDIAYSIYCWAPFKTHKADSLGDINQQIYRAKLYCNAYQVGNDQREILVDTMICRLEALIDFMTAQAESGDPQFMRNIESGHHLGYMADIDYLHHHNEQITKGVVL